MNVDVAIRVTGAARNCAEHIAALGAAATVCVTEGFASEGFAAIADGEPLADQLLTDEAEQVLIYGGEELLGRLKDLPLGTVWMVLGSGANPLRNVWRLRGAHPWLSGVRLGLLLENPRDKENLSNSPLFTTGRFASILTLGDSGEAEPAVQVAAALMETEPTETEGADEEMEPAVMPSTEQALLTRYSLVRERRSLLARAAAAEADLSELLKETFAARFAISPETALAFAELTGRLAQTAAEYRQVVEQRARVEAQLQDLAWLKDELEM